MKPILFAAAVLMVAPIATAQPPVISGPAGTYTSTVSPPALVSVSFSGPQGLCSATLPAGSVLAVSDASVTITWTTSAPAIPSPPAPAIPSPPAPPRGSHYVAFVTNGYRASIPALQLALKSSPTVAGALKAINPQNQWAVLDVSDPRVAAWAANAHAAPPPYILVFRPNGDGLSKVEVLPATTGEPALVAEVKRLASGGSPR